MPPYKKDPEYQRVKQIIREALARNAKTYYTGIPCKRGHLSPRYTISRCCVACSSRPEQRDYVKFSNRKITKEQYSSKWKLRNMCGNVLGTGQDIAIDHCHKTDIIRGLLCKWCNMGLGLFRDNINSLMSAAIYLTRFVK